MLLCCFFGKSFSEEKIEGKSIFEFIQTLIGDISSQTADPIYLLFGCQFLELGIRSKDRSINERLKIYKAWVKEVVNEKVEKVKKKVEDGEDENSQDLIEAIIRNSLKEKKEG